MYALTGASGQLGRLVLQHLSERVPANQLVAITRDPRRLDDLASTGIAIRRANFTDPSSLPPAFAGVTRLLIISTDDLTSGQRAEHHRAAITAATAAGVAHLVYTSFVGADASSPNPLPRDHGLTEAALADSGATWTALRNNAYADALPTLLGLILSPSELSLPTGDARTSWVTRDDCARVAAAALLADTPPQGALDVTGPEALSLPEVAARLSRLHGHPLTIRTLDDDALTARIAANGLPPQAASGLATMLASIARTGSDGITDTVSRLTGQPATPVDAVLRPLLAHLA